MIPPFYIGQKIVALHDHSMRMFKKGDEFIVLDIKKSDCKCKDWDVHIGIHDDKISMWRCLVCKEEGKSDSSAWYFHSTSFAPIIESKFKEVRFEKLLEESPICAN